MGGSVLASAEALPYTTLFDRNRSVERMVLHCSSEAWMDGESGLQVL
jgi:hypothetical protein